MPKVKINAADIRNRLEAKLQKQSSVTYPEMLSEIAQELIGPLLKDVVNGSKKFDLFNDEMGMIISLRE